MGEICLRIFYFCIEGNQLKGGPDAPVAASWILGL